ncbi:TIGR01459 family HAD-type hydrolase [Sphingomonas alba]|uniref:TIGR01459 family HAD-type hydrolase n=1 Tax=Sphingomonas alba TaxID=2908208 RepID=A0ABT0RJL6_9SPHN|nr:TIGR01459 family HAD-type hydrolase [Sphingomonas alba]MCL6682768.1 TIGR01459 family HAD-type hydrolase [Sphingomonas alba]
MSFWDSLDPKYSVILCDIWGVVHDGVNLYPGSADRLREWREQGRKVILITNAPRTAEAVEAQLGKIGLPRDAWDGIATSGEAGIDAIKTLAHPTGFLGTRQDRRILEDHDLSFVESAFTDIAVTGLDDERERVEEYRAQLESLAARDVLFHCFNPDRIVVRGGVTEPCAGALADIYEGIGGRVEWYGKPFHSIYDYAMSLAGNPPHEAVLAVGDALITDMLGAARQGFGAVFVQSGIHAGEPFPDDFAPQYGLGDWSPVAVVDSLR